MRLIFKFNNVKSFFFLATLLNIINNIINNLFTYNFTLF